MKGIIIVFIVIIIMSLDSIPEYNKDAFLKITGDLIITTQVRGERNKAILRGTEAEKNRSLF